MSGIHRDHRRCRGSTRICAFGRDAVVYSKFHQNLFWSFWATRDRNWPFPVTLAIGFYNSLYTVSQKKQDTQLLAITSLTIIRFSKFFH